MTVNELMGKLYELKQQGYGNRKVIDSHYGVINRVEALLFNGEEYVIDKSNSQDESAIKMVMILCDVMLDFEQE